MPIIDFLKDQVWFNKQNALSEQQQDALEAIDAFFSEGEVNLERQSQDFIQKILDDLKNYQAKDFAEDAGLPDTIFKRALERFKMLSSAHIHAQHHARAVYNNKPLSQCPPDQLMTTEHLDAAMPKSEKNFEVLGTISSDPRGWESVRNAALKALAAGKQVIFPIQSLSHFRLVIATPSRDDPRHIAVELFDSMGKAHAQAAVDIVTSFFGDGNIKIVESQPTHLQKDGYSCGDYVAAHAHQIMGHAIPLVTTLDECGNKDHALRKVTRGGSLEYAPEEHQAHSTQEEELIKTLLSSSNLKPDKTDQYREILKTLIGSKDTIFQKAKDITDAKKDSLTDEEMATVEQAREFRNAGL
jgi:hypothetical protein